MVSLVREHIEEIQALCEEYKMHRVWIFGSALDPASFQDTSDIDFLYEPDKDRMSIREFLDNPYKIKESISELLGRKIDWVRYLPFRNPYFREEIEATKEIIYEYDPESEEVFV